jgi:anaerobic magnesium-protoporphyrin IX monomethyl ester cyclase
MHIVLVSPPYSLAVTGKIPPLNVGYLAAAVESRGHSAGFIDAPALELDIVGTVVEIRARKPDIVGITCLTTTAKTAYALAEAIKAADPKLPVVLGGPHVTAFWNEILDECPGVDFLVPGEGEKALSNLLDRLQARQPVDDLRGIVFRDSEGKTIVAPPEEPYQNLDDIPLCARHVYQQDLYKPLPNQGIRQPLTIMMTSRGCPWARCTFCYQSGPYAHRYRRRSPANVVAEMVYLVRDLGYREILFWDENFCINEKWVAAFCDLLDREKLRVPWTVQGHARNLSLRMLQRMAAAGCYNIFFGIESGNQHILDMVDKGTTLDDCRKAVHWAKQAGMEVRASFIIGFPTETPAMAENTIRFAFELNTDYFLLVPYHPWRGTPLGEFALQHGHCIEWNNDWISPSYVPDTFASAQQLADLVMSGYRRYYLRPRYMAQAIWRSRHPYMFLRNLRAFWYWVTLMRRPNIAGR